MSDYQEDVKQIPWTSTGRESIACKVGRSLVPVGVLPFQPVPFAGGTPPTISKDHPEWEKFLMYIVGTAIQGGDHKFVTCLHVLKAIDELQSDAYFLARLTRASDVIYMPYQLEKGLGYVDPRTGRINTDVDLAVLISSAAGTPEIPYEIPVAEWGDSAELGVGDPVIVGGFPHGSDMFKFTKSNRGFIQPTFYHGIVSGILPATKPGETRLIQLSVPCAGGMSGGAVFDPQNGRVLGMITSCVHIQSVPVPIPQPMSYAIPSEIIVPFVKAITFVTKSGKKY